MTTRARPTRILGAATVAVLLLPAAAHAGWNQIACGASPVNAAANQNATQADLAQVAGVPHVAWREDDGGNFEIRVARLNAAGTAWERVGEAADPASPINAVDTHDASQPSLASVGGVPHVAWEEDDTVNR